MVKVSEVTSVPAPEARPAAIVRSCAHHSANAEIYADEWRVDMVGPAGRVLLETAAWRVSIQG